MTLLKKIFKNEIFYHVLFWIAHFIFRLYLVEYFINFSSRALYQEFVTLPVRMFGAYLTIYLLKEYLFNRKYLKFAILLPLSVLLVLTIRRLVAYFIVEPLFYKNIAQTDLKNIYFIIKYIVYVYPVISVAVLITFLRKWYSDQVIKRNLEKEKLTAQLNLLKGQIQPHFLFNILKMKNTTIVPEIFKPFITFPFFNLINR